MKRRREPEEDASTERERAEEHPRDAGGLERIDVSGASDADASVESPAAESLSELETKAAERDELLARLQRTRADLANYQKRVERDMVDVRRYALQAFFFDLLTLVDDFDRALEAAEETRDFDGLVEGVRLMENRIKKLLGDAGVAPIDALGMPFDPHVHEAVLQEETDEAPSNTVLEELSRGYMFHERVLRPARVKVSKAPERGGDETAPDA